MACYVGAGMKWRGRMMGYNKGGGGAEWVPAWVWDACQGWV